MLNPISALGSALSNAVESTLDAVLPKQLEFVGDLASLAIDLRSGNVLKALDDLHDLFKDLPQQLGELTKKEAQGTGDGDGDGEDDCVASAEFEPTPPPPHYEAGPRPLETAQRPRDTGTEGTGTPRAPESGARPGFGGPLRSPDAPVTRGAPPVSEEMDGGTAVTQRTRATAKAAPEGTEKTTAAKKPAAPEPAEKAKAAGGAKASGTAGAKDAKEAAAAKEAATAFFKQSDEALMADLRNGDLPKAVSESPAQMQRLQLRMQEITQMNQLITTMLTAMHDMNKQVIQNLRV